MTRKLGHYLIQRKPKKGLRGRLDFINGYESLKSALTEEGYSAIDWAMDPRTSHEDVSRIILKCKPTLAEEHIEVIRDANYYVEQITAEQSKELFSYAKEIYDKKREFLRLEAARRALLGPRKRLGLQVGRGTSIPANPKAD